MVLVLWLRRGGQPSARSLLHIPSQAFTSFQEGDHLLLKPANDPSQNGYLSKPLDARDSFHSTHGRLKHADLIGKKPREVITTKKGFPFRLHEASLADYVVLSKRLVTPIYPAHANAIVSLLELHPTQASNSRKLEILEAGTGHGGLTLYLARAIHAANPPCPELLCSSLSSAKVDAKADTGTKEKSRQPDDSAILDWKKSRHGIIHTLDISEKYSDFARQLVRNFRRGLYYGNVDFHVGDLSTFFDRRTSSPSGSAARLDHIILDMPATDEQLSIVAPHLHPDGKLLVFNPSITQIVDCARVIATQNLPLELECVIELPQLPAGGREWDVRIVPIRRPAAEQEKAKPTTGWLEWLRGMLRWSARKAPLPSPAMAAICRPKTVSQMTVGGFVAVWRKRSNEEQGMR